MDTKQRAGPARRSVVAVAVISLLALGIGVLVRYPTGTADPLPATEEGTMSKPYTSNVDTKDAIFAGGCFWCIESAFEMLPGVIEAISGYTGGQIENPTYEQVSSGTTGHFEAVLVRYDPEQVSYEQLLDQFWRHIDPTDAGGQFYDRGSPYFTAIFYKDETQRESAENSKRWLSESNLFDGPIVTQILPAQVFYPAEDYHQDYYRTCAVQYNAYSKASGRDDYLLQQWGGSDAGAPESSEDD